MEKRSRGLTKVVGAALIFLTLVSTAVVVAKNCHVEQIPALEKPDGAVDGRVLCDLCSSQFLPA